MFGIILNYLSCPFTDSIVSKPRRSCLPGSFFAPAFSKLMCWLGVEYHVDHLIFSPGSPSSFEIQPCHPQEAHPFWSPASLSLYQSWSVFVGLHRVQVHIHSCILHACIWLHPEAFGLRDKNMNNITSWTKVGNLEIGFLINCNTMISSTFHPSSRLCPIFTPKHPHSYPNPQLKPYEKPYEWTSTPSRFTILPSSQVSGQAIHVNQKLGFESPRGLDQRIQRSMVASTRWGERALLATLRSCWRW